jgi:hypothetical protein
MLDEVLNPESRPAISPVRMVSVIVKKRHVTRRDTGN